MALPTAKFGEHGAGEADLPGEPGGLEEASQLIPLGADGDANDMDDVVGPLLKYSLRLASTNPLSAPIKMPDEDALTVRLVPIHQLQRFDELRDDAALWQAIAWTAGGGVLGFITNFLVAQRAPTDFASYAMIGLLGLIAVGAIHRHAMVARRIERIRTKLFDP